ncbi:hypothetical protein CDV36_006087 [Fusarium kuroshium]|uniref:Uncharacterized protein n=1 Tax=Fusarium kuroshium TaxID=2010991 RepID=A0A3M2S9M8_9HYPO|nr:hypothetical protein CDV36_006087 [Fusarium kuroshium]
MRQLFMDFMRMVSDASSTHERSEDVAQPTPSSPEYDREQHRLTVSLSSASEMRDGARANSWEFAQREAQMCLRTLISIPRESCSQGCRCRCHFNESSYASWNWVQPLLGSWIVRCNNIPYHRRPQCTDSGCTSGDLTNMSLEYRVPRWLVSGLQYFRMSYTTLGGVSCSLRPARVIQITDLIWTHIRLPSEIAYRAILEGPRFYPDDHDISGLSLIEYAVEECWFSAIEVLLNIWGSIVSEQGFPRTILYKVKQILLYSSDLSDHEVYLLNKVNSLVRDMPGWATTEVHKSIYEGKGLQKALREQPWAIDMLDDMGEAPLHTACKLGRAEEVEELIAAKADINQIGCRGWAPLFTAANYSSLDCAKLLIKAGCAVQLTDRAGATALHYAAWGTSHQLVSFLLAAGASTTTLDKWCNSPLHYLAEHSDADPKTLRTIIELLILTNPSSIEAANENGMTPILTALATNHLASLQGLQEAGASLFAVTYYSRNILHLAAMYCTEHILNFLVTLEISGVDTELQDDPHADTPWDQFRFSMLAPESKLGTGHRPSPQEQKAFAKLYQGIRNRNLEHDIRHLDQALVALRRRCTAEARQHIAVPKKQKEDWKQPELANWYRAVDKRIQHSEWNLAMEDVQDYVQELKAELDNSIWDISSKYDQIWDASS